MFLDYIPENVTKGWPANLVAEAAGFVVSLGKPFPRGLAAGRRFGSDRAF
jgi:hypothetical protein